MVKKVTFLELVGERSISALTRTVPFLFFFSGTSAATPVWSGVVTLLNDARYHASMPSLGFLNPWLYSLSTAAPGALRDIAAGVSTPTGCGKVR